MTNPYLPQPVRLVSKVDESPTIATYRLAPAKSFSFQAGQFIELTVPGQGEAPFTPSSSPHETSELEVTVMKVGRLTRALAGQTPGAELGLRGPFGKRYPLEAFEGKDILIVGGGVGLAPLRSLFLALAHDAARYGTLYLRYGARTPEDIIYKEQLGEWRGRPRVDVALSVDVGAPGWTGRVGVVTVLLESIPCTPARSVAVVCGPPVMMKFVTRRLLDLGFAGTDIYLSMEQNMSCGIGKCGHCRLGSFFVCEDGPVLTWDQIRDIPEPF